jgi:starch synthase
MKILMISSEGWPLSRSGALSDVLTALPRELKARGHEICLAMPYYRELQAVPALTARSLPVSIEIVLDTDTYPAQILEGRTPEGLQIFFIRCDEFFDRPRVYGEMGEPYADNAARFIFFSKAVVELTRRMTPTPEILHAHDWTAALVPVLVRDQRLPFATVLSIHHLEEQGNFPASDFGLTNLPAHYFEPSGIEYFGRMNLLKGGVLFADRIVVAGEAYAHDIQQDSLGEGLAVVLREQAWRLHGILPGADTERWNPTTDPFLPARYGIGSLDVKAISRAALLSDLGLAPDPRGPVFGMVTRLVGEKGFDILLPVLDRLLADDVRLVILGKGDPAYETSLGIAARKFPARLAYRQEYDEALAHLIEGGSDIALIPSRVEPGGYSAMHSLRYGVLPIARATRGTEQIIADYDPATDSGYGFLFYQYGSEPFWDAIKRAREVFFDRPQWDRLIRRAAALDFSWAHAAEQYEELYAGLVPQAHAP